MVLATGLVNTAAASLDGSLDAGPLGVAIGNEGYVLVLWALGLFGIQTCVANLFDGAYVGGGWRVFPLFVVFTIYFWIVVYPSFMLGAAQGLVSPGSSMWSRTERSPVRDHIRAS